MYICNFNKFISCEVKECHKCGWNPEVAYARLKAIIEKMTGNEKEDKNEQAI